MMIDGNDLRNLNFIYVLPGWEGSVANGRVLQDVVVRRNGLKYPRQVVNLNPLFADWEEIFVKVRVIGRFAQGPEDVVEEIERVEAQETTNETFMGFPIVIVNVDDAPGTRENQAAQEELNVSTESTQSPFTTQDELNESTGAAQSSFTTQEGETHQSQKQDDNETVLKV
ncbi:hypothetical protein KY289_001686 [Solanum tuberosum]|nr:hypothetical protein KY289_001686 [Solanum tuberosum]